MSANNKLEQDGGLNALPRASHLGRYVKKNAVKPTLDPQGE